MQYIKINSGKTTLNGLINKDAAEVTVFVDTDTAFTLTLPRADELKLYAVTIKVIGSNALTLLPSGTETIEGYSSLTINKYGYIVVVSDGENLYILNSFNLLRTTNVTTTPYTVSATDDILCVNTNAAPITINMPMGTAGRFLKICNTGTSSKNVTLTQYGAEKIYGDTTETIQDGEVFDMHFNSIEGWW